MTRICRGASDAVAIENSTFWVYFWKGSSFQLIVECHEAMCSRVLKLRNRAIHSSRYETAELRGHFGQQIEDADDPTRRRQGGRVPLDNVNSVKNLSVHLFLKNWSIAVEIRFPTNLHHRLHHSIVGAQWRCNVSAHVLEIFFKFWI